MNRPRFSEISDSRQWAFVNVQASSAVAAQSSRYSTSMSAIELVSQDPASIYEGQRDSGSGFRLINFIATGLGQPSRMNKAIIRTVQYVVNWIDRKCEAETVKLQYSAFVRRCEVEREAADLLALDDHEGKVSPISDVESGGSTVAEVEVESTQRRRGSLDNSYATVLEG